MDSSTIRHLANTRYIIISKHCGSTAIQHIGDASIQYLNKCFYIALATGILHKQYNISQPTQKTINDVAINLMIRFQEFINTNQSLQNVVHVPYIFDDNMFDIGIYQAHLELFLQNSLHIRLNIYTGYTEHQTAWDLHLMNTEESKSTSVSVNPNQHAIPISLGKEGNIEVDLINFNDYHYEYIISIIEPVTDWHNQIILRYQNNADLMIQHLQQFDIGIVDQKTLSSNPKLADTCHNVLTKSNQQKNTETIQSAQSLHTSLSENRSELDARKLISNEQRSSIKNQPVRFDYSRFNREIQTRAIPIHMTSAQKYNTTSSSQTTEHVNINATNSCELQLELEKTKLEYVKNVEQLKQQYSQQLLYLNQQYRAQLEKLEKLNQSHKMR